MSESQRTRIMGRTDSTTLWARASCFLTSARWCRRDSRSLCGCTRCAGKSLKMTRVSDTLSYIAADEKLRDLVVEQWKEYMPSVGRYITLEGGFTIVAMHGEEAVGLISVSLQELPTPLSNAVEGLIDDIEVLETHRRRGIATRLVEQSIERAAAEGACQLRAWSSDDRTEAIPMWKALGFGLVPTSITPPGASEQVDGYYVAMPISH